MLIMLTESSSVMFFLHPSANFRVFKLSKTRIDQFIDSCAHGKDSISCPFPMEAERHVLRIDAGNTFALHIFRSKYERKPPVYVPWVTRHPKRRLKDDPRVMAILRIVKEQFDER